MYCGENLIKKTKLVDSDLHFRKVRNKELKQFYEYSMVHNRDFTVNMMGLSLEFQEKMLKINQILLGLPGKIIMKNIRDYVVELDGEIVAGYSIIAAKDKYEFGNLFTRKEFQRKGIASIIVNKVIAEYTDKPIHLEVEKRNSVATKIYEKYGFEEISIRKEYIMDTPLKTLSFPDGYRARPTQKEDLAKLNRLQTELPNMESLPESYKKYLDKTSKKMFRMQYQYPVVLLNDQEIVGIARALWSRGMPHTADIIATAILTEAKSLYPQFVGYLTNIIREYGINKFLWKTSSRTKQFEEYILPYLNEPAKIWIEMKKNETR